MKWTSNVMKLTGILSAEFQHGFSILLPLVSITIEISPYISVIRVGLDM
jgi:hypothetical protein